MATVLGFGSTDLSSPKNGSDVLLYTKVPIVSDNKV
jgi:hypothetical protein